MDTPSATVAASPLAHIFSSAAAAVPTQMAPAWNTPSWTTVAASAAKTSDVPAPNWLDENHAAAHGASTWSPKAFDGITKLLGFERESRRARQLAVRSGIQERGGLEKRTQMRSMNNEGSLPVGRVQIDAGKSQAFATGMGNFNQHAADSVSAVKKSGHGGLAAMWASKISKGNPYSTYYAGNGLGNTIKAKANMKGNHARSFTTIRSASAANSADTDMTDNILSMMAQVLATATAKSTGAVAAARPANANANANSSKKQG